MPDPADEATSTLNDRPSIRIVLVEPREAGNVGAVARVMRNFGLADLVLVGELPALMPVGGWWASGAEDLVTSAPRFPDLMTAVSDCHVVVATTSSRGRGGEPLLSPREVGGVLGSLRREDRLALVFGREDRGLTETELSMCGQRASIPTDPAFPVMNLAQSVGVFAYALAEAGAPLRESRDEPLADAAHLERAYHAARMVLVESGFLDREHPERIGAELRAWMARSRPTRREAEILLGIVRQVSWWGTRR